MINVLHLGLSYKCNMNCQHCYVDRKEDKLKESDYYEIIDTLYKKGLFFVYYTFGEPLCTELFTKVSGYISNKDIVQILMTNGSLITPELIMLFKQNKIKKVCVSLDHIDSNIHDNNRNYHGAYAKAIESIKQLLNAGVSAEISVTVNDKNALFLHEMYSLAQELNVNFISFLRERRKGSVVNMANQKAYHDFFRYILLNQSKINVLFHDMSLLPIINEMKYNNLINEKIYEKYIEMNKCHNKYTLSVEPNGDVKRCNLQDIVVGNVLLTPLDEILNKGVKKYDDIICGTTIS